MIEGAVALAEQDREDAAAIARVVVGHGQIELPVAIEIAGGDIEGIVADGVIDLGRETTVTLIEQNGNVIRSRVYYREVRKAVAIEIAGRDGERPATGRISHRRLKSAVSIAQQYLDLKNVDDG